MVYLKHNLPRWERPLRPALGALVAIAAISLQSDGVMLWLAFAVAVTLALTGVVGFCPACSILGRRTIRKVP